MKPLILLTTLLFIFTPHKQHAIMTHLPVSSKELTYLALGDSYTIGEAVSDKENFPAQTVAQLKHNNLSFKDPLIIAKTGWTTDELQNAIDKAAIKSSYDIVTLLIGVNNQYRGRTVENYRPEFESLLKQAIHFAGDKKEKVFVLSIPDWGATKFAEGRDRTQIGKEIDEYNSANRSIAAKYGVHYIDITPGSREALNNPALLASDGLHPSGAEYHRWAAVLADSIRQQLQ